MFKWREMVRIVSEEVARAFLLGVIRKDKNCSLACLSSYPSFTRPKCEHPGTMGGGRREMGRGGREGALILTLTLFGLKGIEGNTKGYVSSNAQRRGMRVDR